MSETLRRINLIIFTNMKIWKNSVCKLETIPGLTSPDDTKKMNLLITSHSLAPCFHYWIVIFCDAHSLQSWIDGDWNFGSFRTLKGFLTKTNKGTFPGDWKSCSYQVASREGLYWLFVQYLSHPSHKISDPSAARHVQCIFRQLQLFLNTWQSNRPKTEFSWSSVG